MKKILFLSTSKYIVDIFWRPEFAALAAERGLEIDIPALNGDVTLDKLQAMLPEYDGVITAWGSPLCSREFLAGAPKVKVIGHAAGSVAGVADDSTYAAGLKVTCCNKIMAKGVASYGLFITMLALRNLFAYAGIPRVGLKMVWDNRNNQYCPEKSVIGIWGLGDISRFLIEMLKPVGFKKILLYSDHANADELKKLGVEKADSMEQLFSESDVIHLLSGASEKNLGRVNAALLSKIKDGATLVNCGRARLINEQDFYAEMAKQRFNGVFDVYYQEPLPEDNPLFKLPNVITTPHNAGLPHQDTYVPFILDELKRFFAGEEMKGEIKRERRAVMTNERLWNK